MKIRYIAMFGGVFAFLFSVLLFFGVFIAGEDDDNSSNSSIQVGINLPRVAQAQYEATQHLSLSEAKAGDLVFFHSTYDAGSYVTHVGIYVGNNKMYHAGDPIGYTDLNDSYWQQHLIGAGRIKQ